MPLDSSSMAAAALQIGVSQEEVDDIAEDLDMLFKTISKTDNGIPIGSQVVKQMSAGRIWQTPDGRYIIEETLFNTEAPDPPPPSPTQPIPDEDYTPPPWPPEPPVNNPQPDDPPPPGAPQCRKQIFLPNNSKMARMERIQSFDYATLTGDFPTFVEPKKNGNGDMGIIAGSNPLVFTEPETLVPGDGKQGMSRSYVKITVDIGPGKTQLLPLNGVNTALIDRPLKVVNLNMSSNFAIMPPQGIQFLRGSNGCIYMTSASPINEEIEIEIRDMLRIATPTAHKNFKYRGLYDDPTYLNNISKKFTPHPMMPGRMVVEEKEEVFICAEKTPRVVKRQLRGIVPMMDQACIDMADRIIEEILFAKAMEYKEKVSKGGSIKGSQRSLLEAFDLLLDSGLTISNYQDLYDGLQSTTNIGLFVSRIAKWAQAGFDCKKAATDIFSIAYLQAGACAQKSAVAFLVLNRLGIPTRYIGNSCHAYIEVYGPGTETWYCIDLGGCNPPGPTGPSDDGQDQDPESVPSEENDIPDDEESDSSSTDDSDDSDDSDEDDGDEDDEESDEDGEDGDSEDGEDSDGEDGEGEDGEDGEGEGEDGEGGEGEDQTPEGNSNDVEGFKMDAWAIATQNLVERGYSITEAQEAIGKAQLWGGFE